MKKHHFILPLTGLILFAALWVYVQSDHFSVRIRPYVAGPLQEILGAGSQVGWVKANLLPPYIEARDIVIPSDRNAAAVTVRKIKISVNPLPLLWKRVSIPSITVLEPRVAAVRSASGETDLLALARSVAEKLQRRGAAGQSSYEVDIRSIVITNGTARFVDDPSGSIVTITKLNASARMRSKRGALDIRSLSGHVDVNVPAYPRLEGDLHAALTLADASVTVREASLHSPILQLAATGSVGLGPDDPVQLKLSLRTGGQQRKIAAFLKKRLLPQQPVAEVSLAVSGRRSSPVVEGTAKLGDLSYGNLVLKDAGVRFSYRGHTATVNGENWTVSRKGRSVGIGSILVKAAYEKGAMLVEEARIASEDLLLAASGRLDPASGYELKMSGRSWGNGTMISVLTGIDIRGDLAVSGEVTGAVARPRFAGTFSGGPFSVRSVPFTGAAGTLNYANAVFSLSDATIVQDRSRYDFEGSVNVAGPSPVFDATLDADGADVASIVALFYERIPLEIAATGRLSFRGTTTDYSGSARLEVAAGSAYGESFDSGTLSAELTPARVSFPSVIVHKKGGTIRGSGWIGFDGTYSADITSEGTDVSAVDRAAPFSLSGPLSLAITSSGRFSKPVVKARAEVSPLSYKGYAAGASVCELNLEEGRLLLVLTVRRGDGGSADMTGSLLLSSPYAWTVSGKVKAKDLDAASFGAGNDLLTKARMGVDARFELAGSGSDASSLRGVLAVPRLSVVLGDYHIQNEGDLRVHIRGRKVLIDSFVLAGQGTKASLAGSADIASTLDLTLSGEANLSLLRFATRAVEHGDGSAMANVRITEAWNDPNITGEVAIRNGLVKIRDVPQRFTGLAGTVTFDRNRIATEGLRGEFGGGTITVNGSAQMKNLALVDFTSRTLMENVTFRYPPGVTAALGGTLYYDGDLTSQTLSGELDIRRARYDRRVDFKTMLIDVSRGFKAKTKDDLGLLGDTILDVRVVGKEDIILENNLAKIPFEMDMLFRGTVNHVQVLGHMEARKGEVYFRKNVFKILHASADFADLNRINPVLDVEAETRVREYQIRLTVTGSADRATVSFVSEPPLTDSNILALLTIGRTTEDIRGKEAGVGSGEAIGIATGWAQDIVESRARSLTGLDRFQVDPYFSKADVAVPRVTAGKELVKDKVYVTYSSNVGAANPEQMFSIEYLMNKNVSLVGERNDIGNLGADIKFRFTFR